jgi:hypothetical protein
LLAVAATIAEETMEETENPQTIARANEE